MLTAVELRRRFFSFSESSFADFSISLSLGNFFGAGTLIATSWMTAGVTVTGAGVTGGGVGVGCGTTSAVACAGFIRSCDAVDLVGADCLVVVVVGGKSGKLEFELSE